MTISLHFHGDETTQLLAVPIKPAPRSPLRRSGPQRAAAARRHDKAPEVNFVAPEPEDLEAELARIRSWFKRIKSYRGN